MADDLQARHEALIARDREIGLMAQAETARAHAAHVEAKLDAARERLKRKNARIEQLAARVEELEAQAAPSVLRRVTRLARRG